MATKVVAIPIRSPAGRRSAAAAAVLAAAVALELWLVAVVVLVGALTCRRVRHRTRRLLPILLARRALIAQAEPATAAEEWAAAWLAVLSGGAPRQLRRASRLVTTQEADPWRAQVAVTRLEAAEEALATGRVVGLSPRRGLPAPVVATLGGSVTALVVVLSGAGGRWWLLPLGLLAVAFSLAVQDLEEHRTLPKVLAAEATNPEVTAGLSGEGDTPVLDLVLLAGGDQDCLGRARRLVETASRPVPGSDRAARQLRRAESALEQAADRFTLVCDGGLHWWIGQPGARPEFEKDNR